jgi:hypothetical protein
VDTGRPGAGADGQDRAAGQPVREIHLDMIPGRGYMIGPVF